MKDIVRTPVAAGALLALASAVNYVGWLGWDPLKEPGEFGYNAGTYSAAQIWGLGLTQVVFVGAAVWVCRQWKAALVVAPVWTFVFAQIAERECSSNGCDGLWVLGAFLLFVGTLAISAGVGGITQAIRAQRTTDEIASPATPEE